MASFSLARGALLEALRRVALARVRSSTLPALNTVLVELRDGPVRFTCTDIETTIETTVAAVVSGQGAVCVPVARFVELIAAIPSTSVIECALHDNRLTVTAGRSKFELPGLSVEEFPKVERSTGKSVQVDGRWLVGALGRANTLIDAGESLRAVPAIAGALISLGKEKSFVLGTDRYRMGRFSLPSANGKSLSGEFVVPKVAGAIAVKLFAADESVALTGESRHRITIEGASSTLTARLYEAPYPDTAPLFAAPSEAEVVVDRALLIAALGRVGTLAPDEQLTVRFAPSEIQIEVASEEGKGEDVVPCAFSSATQKPYEMCFNGRYFADVLSVLTTSEVRLRITGRKKAILLDGVGDATTEALVMPIRRKGES